MVYGKFINYENEFEDVYVIRKRVFHEEQGIPMDIIFDEDDKKAIHVVVYEDIDHKVAVGVGRIVNHGHEYKIGRVAVLKEHRGKKYGDFAVRMLINKAFMQGADSIYLNAQTESKEFYEKIGFRTVGNEFYEAGILHVRMEIIREDEVVHCCKNSKNK
ncbi:GNAT family N-acetyltransferase [Mobilitalea sibirica]|uniref:GNAT family N-acetyltransferase n=1 Tax=Mobilitalea sibirica TaxID=1462919 RepID=A0A8J7H4N6_9FIRM|nr:GNAT family N-acetyltransferase [Mobilitalea sibirica]MBH1942493.1 GNAT family N-acetyltransferase [Mobilitalea sibirica]